jgi:pentapeptide MXKDX repeat protein
MSKHPKAQGDGAGRAIPLDAMQQDAVSLDAMQQDAVSLDAMQQDAVSLDAVSLDAVSLAEKHSHDGHSHDGHSHRLHAHADQGAQPPSKTAKVADAPDGPRVPCIVIVDEDVELCEGLSLTIGASCQTHCVAPAGAVALLQSLPAVDVALVDCDPPPSVQAPIFGELARWPSAICVLMSANTQKVEQFRALGVFAPLVLDKPVHPEALEAIRSATLELCRALG